jgi:hypothetical protein
MPISNYSAQEYDKPIRIFKVTEEIEVYDGHLALLVDHLLNHIKVLVAIAHAPGGPNLVKAIEKHPLIKKTSLDVRSPERILLADCIRMLDSLVELSHLTVDSENIKQVVFELEEIRKAVPFLDYRYEDDTFPSDAERE